MAVFILLQDNNQYLAVEPNKLLLNLVAPYRTQLGYNIQVPVLDENKQPVLNEDKTPKTETRFQSLIEFNVKIEQEPAPAPAPGPVAVKSPAKAKKRKR